MKENCMHVKKYLYRFIYSRILQSAQFTCFRLLFWHKLSTLKLLNQVHPCTQRFALSLELEYYKYLSIYYPTPSGDHRQVYSFYFSVGKLNQLMTVANSLDPDLTIQNVGSDLNPNCLTILKFSKRQLKDYEKLCGMQ